jgi:hypothetical protein
VLVVLALPLQYLQDGADLPGVDFFRAFSGDDPDLEPDFDPARPFPLRNIIARYPDIMKYSRRVIRAISWVFPLGWAAHSRFFLLSYSGGFSAG